MPRDSRALLPARDRSVAEPKLRHGRCSHGLQSRLSRAFPGWPKRRFPDPYPLALSAAGSENQAARRSRALSANRVVIPLRRRQLS
jgi:hypothetical protein